MDIGTLTGKLELEDALSGVAAAAAANVEKFSADLQETLDFSVNYWSSSLKKIGSEVTDFGQSLSIVVTAPLVAMAAASIAASISVSNAMGVIAKTTGASGADLTALGVNFRNVFSTVSNSAPEVAKALADVSVRLRELNLSGPELENLTRQFLNFAQANNVDVASATRTVTTLMKALELPLSDVGVMMDKLTYASQQSGASVTDLASGMIKGGLAFVELGFGVDQSLALFAQFEKVGANVTDVTSSLDKVMRQFAKAGVPDAKEAFAKLLEEIKAAPTYMEAAKLSTEAFGRSGVKLTEEIRGGTFATGEFEAALANIAGLTDRTAKASESFAEKMAILRNRVVLAIEPLGKDLLTAFESLIPYIENGIEGLTSMVEWFTKLPQPVQVVSLALLALTAATGPVVIVVGQLIGAVAVIMPYLAPLKVAFAALGTAAAGITLPVVLTTAAIVALAGALYKVAGAFIEADKAIAEGRFIEFITAKDSDNWVRRWLGLGGSIKTLDTNVSDLGVKIPQVTSAFDDLSTSAVGGTTGMSAAEAAITKLRAEVAKIPPDVRKSITALDDMGSSNAEIAATISRDFKISEDAVKAFLKQTQDAATATKKTSTDIQQEVKAAWERFADDIDNYGKAIEAANESIRASNLITWTDFTKILEEKFTGPMVESLLLIERARREHADKMLLLNKTGVALEFAELAIKQRNELALLASMKVAYGKFYAEKLAMATAENAAELEALRLKIDQEQAGLAFANMVPPPPTELEQWNAGLSTLSQSFAQVAQISDGAFGDIAEQIGKTVGAMDLGTKGALQLEKGLDAFSKGNIAAGFINTAAGIMTMVAALDTATASGSRASRIFQGASTGAQMGTQILPGWGTAIGAGIGALVGWLRGGEVKGVMDDVGSVWGQEISQGLADEIADSSKDIGDRWTATMLRLADVVEDLGGVTAENFSVVTRETRNLFAGLERGQLTLEQVNEQFGLLAPQILATALAGNEVDFTDFLSLLQVAEEAGADMTTLNEEVVRLASSFDLMDEATFNKLRAVLQETGVDLEGMDAAIVGIISDLENISGETFSRLLELIGMSTDGIEGMDEALVALASDLTTLSPEAFERLIKLIGLSTDGVEGLGEVIASQLVSALNEAVDAGRPFSQSMLDAIANAKALGIATDELAEIVSKSQSNSISSLAKLIENITITGESGKASAKAISIAFDAILASGADINELFDAVGGSFETLISQFLELGQEDLFERFTAEGADISKMFDDLRPVLGDATDDLRKLFDAGDISKFETALDSALEGLTDGELLSVFQTLGLEGADAFARIAAMAAVTGNEISNKAVSAAQGAVGVIVSLQQQGALTSTTFEAMTGQVFAAFKAMESQGQGGTQALQRLRQPLQTIWELVTDQNMAVDEGTRLLLDQALAAGIVGDSQRSAADKTALALDRIVIVLEAMAKFMGVDLPAAAAAMAAGTTAAAAESEQAVSGMKTALGDVQTVMGGTGSKVKASFGSPIETELDKIQKKVRTGVIPSIEDLASRGQIGGQELETAFGEVDSAIGELPASLSTVRQAIRDLAADGVRDLEPLKNAINDLIVMKSPTGLEGVAYYARLAALAIRTFSDSSVTSVRRVGDALTKTISALSTGPIDSANGGPFRYLVEGLAEVDMSLDRIANSGIVRAFQQITSALRGLDMKRFEDQLRDSSGFGGGLVDKLKGLRRENTIGVAEGPMKDYWKLAFQLEDEIAGLGPDPATYRAKWEKSRVVIQQQLTYQLEDLRDAKAREIKSLGETPDQYDKTYAKAAEKIAKNFAKKEKTLADSYQSELQMIDELEQAQRPLYGLGDPDTWVSEVDDVYDEMREAAKKTYDDTVTEAQEARDEEIEGLGPLPSEYRAIYAETLIAINDYYARMEERARESAEIALDSIGPIPDEYDRLYTEAVDLVKEKYRLLVEAAAKAAELTVDAWAVVEEMFKRLGVLIPTVPAGPIGGGSMELISTASAVKRMMAEAQASSQIVRDAGINAPTSGGVSGSFSYDPRNASQKGGTAILQVNGRTLAEVIVPEIPGVVKTYGLV